MRDRTKELTESGRNRLSLAVTKELTGKFGKHSRCWKGDKAGYVAKHLWMKKHYGKPCKCENKKCSFKNPKRFTWANLSGMYSRKRSDWKMMCMSCNLKHDFSRDIKSCPHGHYYDEENTILNTRGHRICRKCRKERGK